MQKDPFPILGTMLLSAVLKEHNYDSDVLIEACEKKFLNSIRKTEPQVVCFYCTTGLENWVFRWAKIIKKDIDGLIIVGGPHATFFPDIINNPNIDMICQGEGEYALLELMNALRDKKNNSVKIKNLWQKVYGQVYQNETRDLIENLDELPYPDFDIYSKYRFLASFIKERYPIIAGRGCLYSCSFCHNHALKKFYKARGRYIRRRSVDNVISELLQAKEKYQIRKFIFYDDDFPSDFHWLSLFAQEYSKKIRLPFICDAHVDSVNEATLKILKEMGCICIKMGVESGNDRIRQRVLNKNITNDQIKAAAALIKKYRINLKACNILGSPSESVNDALDTFCLNKAINPDFVFCSLLQPYPGTKILRYAKRINAVYRDNKTDNIEFAESSYRYNPIKLERKNEIVNLQRLMHIFIKLHLPLSLVKVIIRIPVNIISYLIFKISFGYGIYKIEKLRLFPFLRFARRITSYV